MANGENGKGFFSSPVTLREIALAIAVTASLVAYYFTGISASTDRISRIEGDLNQQLQRVDTALADRAGKLETRIAVIEQHQTQEDAAVTDTRTSLNSFTVEMRTQLAKISDQIAELRPLIQQHAASR